MIRVLVSAFAAAVVAVSMIAFGPLVASAMAFEMQVIHVPQSGIKGDAEIRREIGIFCRDKYSAERLLNAHAVAKQKFAHGAMAGGTTANAVEEELACKLDALTVAGVFPSGKLSVPVIVPVRLIGARGPEIRYLVMK